MFRKMRRSRQELSADETRRILLDGTTGTLALSGDNGYPYSVPVNYYYDGVDKIYFHCAKQGHKTDAILRDDRISMSVIERNDILQEKFTTLFSSVIVFGRAKIIDEPQEVRLHGERLAERLCPDNLSAIPAELDKGADNMLIVEITVEHMTGKQCIEMV